MLKNFIISSLFLGSVCFFLFQGNFIIYFPIYFEYFDLTWMKDWVSKLFLSLLFLITASVLIFSKFYMLHKLFKKRFVLLLVCFVISMIMIIVFPMSIFMLLGWDGLGMFSFLLVAFYKAKSSWSASLKTFLTNRMGDGFFLLFFALLVSKDFWFNDKMLVYSMTFIMMLACFTKSAQMPFSSWLPAAMAAPTPVSSLVHSSTLVTAGVYLLMRLKCDSLLLLFSILGLFTSLIASLSAMNEYDAKKIVALSTLSNLGMMVYSLSIGIPLITFFHLLTHALAKAKLFVSVGWLMMNKNHHQDIRVLKNKIQTKFLLNLNMSVCMWSLSGMIFFSGYFSKESMLEIYSASFLKIILNGMFLSVILFSFLYGFRLFFMLGFNLNFYNNIKLSTSNFSFSMLFLLFCSVFFGKIFNKTFFVITFVTSYQKYMVYSFLIFSLMILIKNMFFQNNVFNELLYMKFLGSSYGILMGNYSKFLYETLKINTMRIFEVSSANWLNKVLKYLTTKSLNFSIWICFFLILCFF